MARSNTEPEPVEIKRMRIEDEGLAVDLLLHWDITSYEEEDVDGDLHTVWEYEEELKTLHFDSDREQARGFIRANENTMLLLGRTKAQARREESVLSTAEEEKLIDYETGKRINVKVHGASGLEEQIGILRYAITELYNRLGETAPTELQDLNAITNEEIQAGQDRKTNL